MGFAKIGIGLQKSVFFHRQLKFFVHLSLDGIYKKSCNNFFYFKPKSVELMQKQLLVIDFTYKTCHHCKICNISYYLKLADGPSVTREKI